MTDNINGERVKLHSYDQIRNSESRKDIDLNSIAKENKNSSEMKGFKNNCNSLSSCGFRTPITFYTLF